MRSPSGSPNLQVTPLGGVSGDKDQLPAPTLALCAMKQTPGDISEIYCVHTKSKTPLSDLPLAHPQ